MFHRIRDLLLPLAFLVFVGGAEAQLTGAVLVNELMASNGSTIVDGTGAYPDWIELFNPGTQPYVLVGHFITDDPAQPFKHQLVGDPAALTVPAGGFLLLWASGNPLQGPAHLGFALSSAGESLQLREPDGTTLVDTLTFGPQSSDVSYGRNVDGGGAWVYFNSPTPLASNASGTGILGYLQPVEFSVASGFHMAPMSVTISSPDPDVTIYYSRDGSIPGPDRVAGEAFQFKDLYPEDPGDPVGPLLNDTMRSFIQAGSVIIDVPGLGPNDLSLKATTFSDEHPAPFMPLVPVRKGIVIKARAFKEGYVPSPVSTQTYFITSDGTNPYELPVVALSTDEANLFGFDDGVYTAGVDFDEWRIANPGTPIWDGAGANYHRDTEYPLTMEIFGPQQPLRDHVIDAGFRMHGNWTLARPRKSMKLYFRSEYGENDLKYPIFLDQEDDDYKRLLIRNGGNDETHTNLRDISMQKMVGHMRFATQDSRSISLFVNGEYWGVHHVRERLDRYYIERHYGIEQQDLDLLEINASVVEGTADHYLDMIDLVSNSDVSQDVIYDDVVTRMDVDDFIDFQSACIFIGNTDWPHNNLKMYRKRNVAYLPEAPHPHDGRWRWMMYDTDFGFGYYGGRDASFDYLGWAISPNGNGFGSWSTLLFRRLLLNTAFRNAFINRHADMLNTAYRTEVTSGIIQAKRDLMAPDMDEHFSRWVGRPGSFGVWDYNIDVLYAYSQERPDHARQEMMDHFSLPAQHTVTVDVSHAERGYVELNSIAILESTHGVDPDPYPWQGEYFATVPITLTAHANPGAVFLYWEGDISSTDPTITIDLTEAISVTAVFGEAEICPRDVVHYWHFNDLVDGALSEVLPDLSVVEGAVITYPGTGDGYMDPTVDEEGSELNTQFGNLAGRGLRARDPSDVRELIIAVPSIGYRDLILSYAAMRSPNGAEQQAVAWTVDPEQQIWHSMPPGWLASPDYSIRTYDLSDEPSTWNNPYLAFRVRFSGNGAGGSGGNHRFDNVVLSGQAMPLIEATLCTDSEFTYEGVTYDMPGNYVQMTGDPIDCDAFVILALSPFDPDTSVTMAGVELFANTLADSYQWVDCNAGMAPIPGADEQFFVPWTGGTYAVIGSEDGCTWMSGCHTLIITGISAERHQEMIAFPNPASDVLMIQLDDGSEGSSFQVIDLLGATVREGRITGPLTRVGVSELASGPYVIRIIGSGGLRIPFMKL